MAIVRDNPARSHWVSYIRQRLRNNRNFIGLAVGSTGSGKSWSCISIAHMIDPSFTVERIIFDPLELVRMFNQGKLQRGSAVVFEEVGCTLDSASWQSALNRLMRHVFETCRSKNNILLLNTPSPTFLSKGVRLLVHAHLTPIGIDKQAGVCRMKAELIQHNTKLDKVYYKRLRVVTPDGVVPVNAWRVPKPPKNLIKEYEAKKKQFTNEMYVDIEKEIVALRAQPKKRERFPAACKNCAYEWRALSPTPSKCPKCHSGRTEAVPLHTPQHALKTT